MKEYTPPRHESLLCEHFDDDGEPIPCPGMCPKLVIKSWAPPGYPDLGPTDPNTGKPIMHAIVFTETEVRTLVREADRGYFDMPGMLERKDSRFWDPLTSMLIQSLQENPVRALGILLFLGQPAAIAFAAEPEPILALQDPEGSWLWIHLNGTTPSEVQAESSEPAEPDGEEIDVPQPVTYHDTPPAGANMLWTRPTPEVNGEDRYDVTDNGNAALDA